MSNLKLKVILEGIDKLTSPVRAMSKAIRSNLSSINRDILGLGHSVSGLGKSMQGIGFGLSTRLSLPIAGLGITSVKTAAQFEKFMAMLKTAEGSSEKAQKAFDRIKAFAETTPYELTEVTDAYIKLKNLGLDPSEEALRSYGNTASAMGKSLNQYIEAVADASTGEFERLKEFGIKARSNSKKVAFTFQGETKIVKKNAESIAAYLKSIGDTKFAGSMEEQMDGLNGAFSNFNDTVSTTFAEFGQDVSKTLDLKKVIRELSLDIKLLLNGFHALPPAQQEFIIKGGLMLGVIGPILTGFSQIVIATGFAVTGLAKFGGMIAFVAKAIDVLLIRNLLAATRVIIALGAAFLATPFGWVVAGIAAVASVYMLIQNWETVKAFWASLWEGIKKNVADAVEYIRPLIEWVTGAMDGVIKSVDAARSYITDNAVTRGISGLFETSPAASPAAPNAGIAVGSPINSGMNTGGTLNIKIDAEGRPSVVESRPADKRQKFNVDTGLIMGGAY